MPTIISGDGSADFNTPLPVAEGGTGASTAAGACAALGIVNGANTVSMVRLTGIGSNGSTNNKIPRWSTVVTNTGTDITYADSATLGSSFTINTAGVYNFSFTGGMSSGGSFVGFSLNTTTPTTTIQSIALSEILAAGYSPTGGVACASWQGYLPAGSVVRPHTDGTIMNTATTVSAVRVA